LTFYFLEKGGKMGVTHLRVRQEKKHPFVRNFTTFSLYVFLLYTEAVSKVVRAHHFYQIWMAALKSIRTSLAGVLSRRSSLSEVGSRQAKTGLPIGIKAWHPEQTGHGPWL
jgi:hypothetical protein